MSQELYNTAILAGSFLLLFALAEVLYHKCATKVEYTRKLVHFGTGLLTLLFPFLLNNHWLVLLLCGSFLLILILSLKWNLLPSINAIDRISYGSIFYPVSVYGCYLVYHYKHNNLIFFYLPILILAVCDPLAALIGKSLPLGKFKIAGQGTKTLAGTSAFFISSFILATMVLWRLNDTHLKLPAVFASALLIAGCSASIEAISSKGVDNITIPITVLAVLILITW